MSNRVMAAAGWAIALGLVVFFVPPAMVALAAPYGYRKLRRVGWGRCPILYRFRTRCSGCDLQFGRMGRLVQDRGLCLCASCI